MAAATSPSHSKERAPAPPAAPQKRDLVVALMLAHKDLAGRPDGASLLAAHFVSELGEEELETMPTEALTRHVAQFRMTYPPAWPSVMIGDPNGLATHMRAYGVTKMSAADYQQRASAFLQAHEDRERMRARADVAKRDPSKE